MKHPPARVGAKGAWLSWGTNNNANVYRVGFCATEGGKQIDNTLWGIEKQLSWLRIQKDVAKTFQWHDEYILGPVVNVALEVGNRCWISWGLKGCVHVQVNVDGPEKCKSRVLAYARLHPKRSVTNYIYQFQCQPPENFLYTSIVLNWFIRIPDNLLQNEFHLSHKLFVNLLPRDYHVLQKIIVFFGSTIFCYKMKIVLWSKNHSKTQLLQNDQMGVCFTIHLTSFDNPFFAI